MYRLIALFSISLLSFQAWSVTEQEFAKRIQHLEKLFSPYVKAAGKKLEIEYDWNDATKLGKAQEAGKDRNTWHIFIGGGLTRAPFNRNLDQVDFTVCHELGHFLGGFPRYIHTYRDDETFENISSEGQSDYYAAAACIKKIFKVDDNRKYLLYDDVPLGVRSLCTLAHSTNQERGTCIRIIRAAADFVKYEHKRLKASQNDTLLERLRLPVWTWALHPSPYEAPQTIHEGYPSPRCRFDTYVAGALCNKNISLDLRDELRQEEELCNKEYAARPRCWFNPENSRHF